MKKAEKNPILFARILTRFAEIVRESCGDDICGEQRRTEIGSCTGFFSETKFYDIKNPSIIECPFP